MKSPNWRIVVLKLDHRPERDKRLTTHIGLTARAFGASELQTSGLKDPKIIQTLEQVCAQWGNQEFRITTGVQWKKQIKKWKEENGEIIHLTMYGLHVDEVISEIRGSPKSKLIVVGGPKVPSEVFKTADYNVAIGHQPHSEVTALSIFLDRLFQGKNLYVKFQDAKLEILPSAHGKQVRESE
ncbi:MAG: tRNA (cytidine(56)-2'-O)-methyltransferase [Promethearchaeota archaeon]